MNELKVHYFRNKLVIDGVPSSDNHIIESLWSSVREDYTNWVADVHLNQIENGKSISESMEWKGMSTWWLIKLAGRDSFLANRWLHRLMMLYLCRMFSKQIEVHTDDKILARCLLQNIPDLSIIYQRTSQESLRENCKLYYPEFFKFIYLLSALTRQMKTWLLLFGFCKRQCVRF